MPWQSLSLIGSLWALFLGGPRVLSADKAMSKLLMYVNAVETAMNGSLGNYSCKLP